MEKGERLQKLGELETELKKFISRERGRLKLERAFLEASIRSSSGAILRKYEKAGNERVVSDVRSLIGLAG